MEQTPTQTFKSDCGKSQIIVDNDCPLGNFHDFLLAVKGHVVEMMVAAQKQEQDVTEAKKKEDLLALAEQDKKEEAEKKENLPVKDTQVEAPPAPEADAQEEVKEEAHQEG